MSLLKDKVQTGQTPLTEEVAECVLCGSSRYEFLFWNFDRLYHLPGKFGLVKCENCGLVRLSPRPTKENLGYYYPDENYYSYQNPTVSINNLTGRKLTLILRQKIRDAVLNSLDYPTEKLASWQKLLTPVFRRFLFTQATYGWGKRFPKYRKNGYVLDVGCGNGSFLSFLKYHGWKVYGIDLNVKAAEVAKKHFDIDVFVGSLEKLPHPDESFDYINMSHVVEHVVSPLDTMKKIRDLLKPAGIVYIEVPNYKSFSQKVSKQLWYPWETPRHLYTFSPDNIRKICENSGLKILELETKVENLFAWDYTYKNEDVLGVKSQERPYISAIDKIEIFFLSLVSRIVHKVYPLKGDFICVWAKKEI